MGYKVSDGKAFDAAAPAATVINDFDLYRINDWNGVAIGAKDTAQTDRNMSFERDPAAIYSIKVPGALAPAVGQLLYWTAGAGFKRGDTDLSATVAGSPAFKCESTKNAAGYVQGRVLNQ